MPRPEDIHVGTRIRQRRHICGLTQQQVAEAIGVKFQQLQKYETGANRVSASRLIDLSGALAVDAAYFFEGLKTPPPAQEIKSAREAELLTAFRSSPANARDAILNIARQTAQASA